VSSRQALKSLEQWERLLATLPKKRTLVNSALMAPFQLIRATVGKRRVSVGSKVHRSRWLGDTRRAAGRPHAEPENTRNFGPARFARVRCDPIEGMAQIAMNEAHPPELRGRMFAELAQYVYPKRKAVELAAETVTPQQSKLVVEFVRARPCEPTDRVPSHAPVGFER